MSELAGNKILHYRILEQAGSPIPGISFFLPECKSLTISMGEAHLFRNALDITFWISND